MGLDLVTLYNTESYDAGSARIQLAEEQAQKRLAEIDAKDVHRSIFLAQGTEMALWDDIMGEALFQVCPRLVVRSAKAPAASFRGGVGPVKI